jgi:hypothetical protein
MPSLVSLLLALRLGTIAPPHGTLSVRDEVRVVAAESILQGSRGADGAAAAVAAVNDLASIAAQRPNEDPFRMLIPLNRPARAGDIVVLLVTRLHADETPVGKAAIWVATRPVQVEASSNRVFVRVRLAGE